MSMTQRLYEKLVATGIRTTGASIDPDDPDLKAILTRGHLFSRHNPQTVRGEDSKCHLNALILFRASHEDIGVATGYANTGGHWVSHTWGMHTWGVGPEGSIIETTNDWIRDGYFGIVLPLTEARKWLEAETRRGLLPDSELARIPQTRDLVKFGRKMNKQ